MTNIVLHGSLGWKPAEVHQCRPRAHCHPLQGPHLNPPTRRPRRWIRARRDQWSHISHPHGNRGNGICVLGRSGQEKVLGGRRLCWPQRIPSIRSLSPEHEIRHSNHFKVWEAVTKWWDVVGRLDIKFDISEWKHRQGLILSSFLNLKLSRVVFWFELINECNVHHKI